MLRHAYAGSPPPRLPTSHPAIAPYGAHRTQNGQIILGLQNEREWVTFCQKVLGSSAIQNDPRFATQPQRRVNREALTAVIEDFFSDKTSEQVAELLDGAGIANGRLNDPIDVWNHVQFAARDKWREIQTEGGPVRALLPPAQLTDQEAAMGDVPSVGQHTDEILRQLGFSTDTIASMRAQGAV
jgi:itaconate CoA-transferase